MTFARVKLPQVMQALYNREHISHMNGPRKSAEKAQDCWLLEILDE